MSLQRILGAAVLTLVITAAYAVTTGGPGDTSKTGPTAEPSAAVISQPASGPEQGG